MLRGAPNFRDVGGHRTADGRRVREGRLLRSGQLGELHEEDIGLLRERFGRDLCVLDLRGQTERVKLACAVPDAVVHSVPIEPSVARKLDAIVECGEALTPVIAQGFMREAYRNFVRNARPQLAAVFGHALQRGGRPLLVHCTAGKDRTGFMIAMLLGSLGVPRESILADYLLTNERVAPKEGGRYAAEIMHVLRTVRAEYLEDALEVVDAEFGGLDAYLQTAAGLTPASRERLREALLAA